MSKSPKKGAVKPSQFRLEPEVLADLDAIRAAFAVETGDGTRSGAIRRLIRAEAARRAKRKEGGK